MFALGLDLGTKRTGVAFGDSDDDFIVALDTIRHDSFDDLIAALRPIVKEKKIDAIYIGLPLLLSGMTGEQARATQKASALMESVLGVPCSFIDERYTSVSTHHCEDKDAMAACAILDIAFSMRKK
jgi:putative Holliday junction resolvase